MEKKGSLFFLFLILLIATFLRLAWIGKIPSGVTGDEIQQGYTGYSILKTGHDEWGDFLPINPRSFGDYKPPLYAYSTILPEMFLGLNIVAVRLPSAIAGILTVFVTYLLAQELFKNKVVSLLAAFFLSISTWHVFYSRVGWESNLGLFLSVLGLYLFIKSFQKQSFIIWSALSWGLALFTYHSYKVFIPLLVLAVIFFYRNQLLKINRSKFLAGALLFTFFVLLTAYSFVFAGGGNRASSESIYNQGYVSNLRDIQVEDTLPNPWNRVINNRIDFLVTQALQNYLGYFSTTFLTSPFRSDSTLFNIPGKGVSGIWLVPFWVLIGFILGLYYMIKEKIPGWQVILAWIFFSPIPASLTQNYMHAQRSESLLYVFPLLASFGTYRFLIYIKNIRYKIILGLAVVWLVLWGFIKDTDFYLFHEFQRPLGGMKYGYQQVVDYVIAHQSSYSKIIFTKSNSEPQAFVAFYSRMDPKYYQSQSQDWKYFETDGLAFLDMIDFSLGKYTFKNIDWNKDSKVKNALIVGTSDEIPANIPLKFTYTYDPAKVYWEIVDTNNLK